MKNTWLTPLAVAFLFMTRIPMPRLEKVSAIDEGRAILFFPVVGLVLGVFFCISAVGLIHAFPSNVSAALLLCLWILITGALHIDALADSADAWLSGATAERALEIMKDPRCGSAAVAIVVGVLLLKFTALTHLVENQLWWPLLIAPVIGRCIAPLILLTTAYVNPQGIGLAYIENAPGPSRLLLVLTIALCAASGVMFNQVELGSTLLTFSLTGLAVYLLRRMMLQRLGGTNGDTAGATVEISEALLLVGFCAL